MLLINGYELAHRTSIIKPYLHGEAGTVFVPFNVVEKNLDNDEVNGYEYDEYRINTAEGLPIEAVQTLLDVILKESAEMGDKLNNSN